MANLWFERSTIIISEFSKYYILIEFANYTIVFSVLRPCFNWGCRP